MNRQRQPATQPNGASTRARPDVAGNAFESETSSRLKRGWAIARWIALVIGCGLGAAFAFAMLIGIVLTVLGV